MDEVAREKKMLDAVILSYRKLIDQRYDYSFLVEHYPIPDSFDEKKVNDFKLYFLEYIYPPPTKRDELNQAFANLDSYIKKPEKIMRILVDSTSLIFKYGRHLPKILRAGMKALKSYRTASRFENRLAKLALNKNLEPPISDKSLKSLISMIPKNTIDEFIQDSEKLFVTIHDRVLVQKINEIVTHLVDKMKSKPNIYSEDEVKAMAIGRDIIVNGDRLFDMLSAKDQKLIINVVVQIEKDFLENIFNEGVN